MLLRGVLGAVLVLVGGLVTNPVPSVDRSRIAWFADIGSSMPGRMGGLAVTVAGLGLLAWAWLSLVQASSNSAPPIGDRLAQVRRAVVLWIIPLVPAPPLFSRDGWSYAAQGAELHAGFSPYVYGPAVLSGPITERVDPMWLWTPAPYGPLPLLWGSVAATVTQDPWLLVIAHRLAAFGGLALLAWAVPQLARWTSHDPAVASAVVLANPLMLAHGVAGLHNDLPAAGLAAAALALARRSGWFPGALLGGLAAAVKAPAGLICIAVALVTLPTLASPGRRLTRLVQVAVVGLGALFAVGWISGAGSGWIHNVGVPMTLRTPLSAPTDIGVGVEWVLRVLGANALSTAAVPAVRVIGVIVLVAVSCWVALKAPTGDRPVGVAAAAVVLLAATVLAPAVHVWYVLWCLPLIASLPLPTRVFRAVLGVSLVAGMTAPLDSSLTGLYVPIVITGTLVLAVIVPLVARTHRSVHAQPPHDSHPRAGDAVDRLVGAGDREVV